MTFYTGCTDDILKSLTDGIKTRTTDSSITATKLRFGDDILIGDDILKSLTVGIKTTTTDSSITATKLPSGDSVLGCSHSVQKVDSPFKHSIAADTKTGVLVQSSYSTSSTTTDKFITSSASASAGYNFGTDLSVGPVIKTQITRENRLGDNYKLSSDLTSFIDITGKKDCLTGRYGIRDGYHEVGIGYDSRGKQFEISASKSGFSINFGYSM